MFDDFKNAGDLPAVNFHLWQACNMRCRFCFATFEDVKHSCLPRGHLPEAKAIQVVRCLCEAGISKITFAGGEPMLCPWLPKLLAEAKRHGVTTMIVTNGTQLTAEWLRDYAHLTDWIALSVDSLKPETNALSGRKAPGKTVPDAQWYMEKAQAIKAAGIRYKVNTVVHRLNAAEDLSQFIAATGPERWKLFQVLPVHGQNDGKVEGLLISLADFEAFVERHQRLLPDIRIVPETNEAMTGSYLMVDPAGRFYDNVDGKHAYSREILEAGVTEALNDVRFDRTKFLGRDGWYDWGQPRP